MSASFGDRLAETLERHGPLCVGIDPHGHLLAEWGLADDAGGLREFGLRVVEEGSGRVGIVKPQVAFFERHGSAGYLALEQVLAAARSAGLLVIADVKRGDVGTSVEAYGQAWLTPGSPLEADAITASAYQGVGSLAAPIALAESAGKGLFVLAATSNPESFESQNAVIRAGRRSGLTVAAGIVADVVEHNARGAGTVGGAGTTGSVGVVLGATVDLTGTGIDAAALAASPATPVLAPGFGAQGARLDRLRALFGAAAPMTIASASRSVLSAGPAGLAAAIDAHRAALLDSEVLG